MQNLASNCVTFHLTFALNYKVSKNILTVKKYLFFDHGFSTVNRRLQL